MHNNRYFISFIFFFCFLSSAYSQVDPLRAAAIIQYGKQNKKVIDRQTGLLALSWEVHVEVTRQQQKIIKFQTDLNNYLTKLDTTLTYLADIYAAYYEVKTAYKNIKDIKSIVIRSPLNVAGLALHKSRNSIYEEVIDAGTKVGADMLTFFKRGRNGVLTTHATHKDRFDAINLMKKHLHDMNTKLRQFAVLLRATSLLDAWYDDTGLIYTPRPPRELATASLRRWRSHIVR